MSGEASIPDSTGTEAPSPTASTTANTTAAEAASIADVRFDAAGLVPAILQDDTSGEVLTLAWMNADTLAETLETGRTVLWSRSRQERWRKGDTSGDIQLVRSVWLDCDGDALVVRVEQRGKGACHTGARSCFFRTLPSNAVPSSAVPSSAVPSVVGTEPDDNRATNDGDEETT